MATDEAGAASGWWYRLTEAIGTLHRLEEKPRDAIIAAAGIQLQATFAAMVFLLVSAFVLQNVVDQEVFIVWGVACLISLILRTRLAPVFGVVLETTEDVRRWGRRLSISALMTGICWAAIPWLPPLSSDLNLHLFLIMLLIGTLTVGSRALFIHPPAFFSMALPIILSVTTHGMLIGTYGHLVAGMTLFLFLPVLISMQWIEHVAQRQTKATEDRLNDLVEEERERSHLLHNSFDALKQLMMELETARDRIAEAERIGAVGRMLAGVAHVINTPVGNALAAISHLDAARCGVETAMRESRFRRSDFEQFLAESAESLPLSRRALERAAALIDEFKQAVVDTDGDSCTRLPLAKVIDDVLTICRAQLSHAGVGLDVELDHSIELDTYPAHLLRALRSLIDNACVHAFPEGWRDPRLSIQLTVIKEGIEIRIADNGIGMSAEVLAQARDPFFTTRRGRGIGLGLYYVENTVKGVLEGIFRMESAEGRGTTISLILPMINRRPRLLQSETLRDAP